MSLTVTVPREDLQALLAASARLGESLTRRDAAPAVRPAPVIATGGQAAAKPAPVDTPFRDEGKFYDWLRANHMLGPKISQDEFTGCDIIVKACYAAGWGISWTAYALATAYHETAHTMLPIKEIGGTAYFTRMYDIKGNRPAKARELGNLTPGDGAKYCGRGYPQTTGKDNYRKATEKLRQLGFDVDLVNQPDRMMEPAIAAATMISGMEEGWFTTRDLADDLPRRGPASMAQFVDSRDIINGRDKDDEIAAYANDWQTALQHGGYREAA